MKLTNIATSCENSLTLLLEEFLDLDTLKVRGSMLNKEHLITNEIELLILDDKTDDLERVLEDFKELPIDIILLGYECKGRDIRNYLKENLIYDYLEKNNFILLKEVINTYFKNRYRAKKILIKDSSLESCIDIEDILYISYDRDNRKSIINTEDNEFYTKKNLGELEELLFPFHIFIRAERGIILNKKRIKHLDYKKEVLIFNNSISIFLSRKTLKNLRKNLDSWDRYIIF